MGRRPPRPALLSFGYGCGADGKHIGRARLILGPSVVPQRSIAGRVDWFTGTALGEAVFRPTEAPGAESAGASAEAPMAGTVSAAAGRAGATTW